MVLNSPFFESVGRSHCLASTLARPGDACWHQRAELPRWRSSLRAGGWIEVWVYLTDGLVQRAVHHHASRQDLVERLASTLALDVQHGTAILGRVCGQARNLFPEPGDSVSVGLAQDTRSAGWWVVRDGVGVTHGTGG